MKLYSNRTGNFKLDEAMLVWYQKLFETKPIQQTKITSDIAARCLLIEEGNQLILVDTGMGNKQSENFLVLFAWGTHLDNY
jgi:hypothetical protein